MAFLGRVWSFLNERAVVAGYFAVDVAVTTVHVAFRGGFRVSVSEVVWAGLFMVEDACVSGVICAVVLLPVSVLHLFGWCFS